MLENYTKAVNIEALTMIDMTKREIVPAVEAYVAELLSTSAAKRAADIACRYETETATRLSALTDLMYDRCSSLEKAALGLKDIESVGTQADYIRDEILPKMAALRVAADEAETLTAEKYWPFPTYGDLLFGVR